VPLAGFHDDVATFAAIAARRATAWHELFSSEGEAAVTAVSSFHSDYGFIDKHVG